MCKKDNCQDNCECYKCCCCCWKWKARALWFPIIVIAFGLMAVLFYYPGYKDNNKWNENAIKTGCTVVSHTPGHIPVSYYRGGGCTGCYYQSCNCVTDCAGGDCGVVCDSCAYAYADGWVTVKYLETFTTTVRTLESDGSTNYKWDEVVRWLAKNYPVNSTVPCYYQKGDPKNFKLFLDPVVVFLVFTFIFVSLMILVILIWSILDITRCIKKKSVKDKEEGNDKEVEVEKEIEMNNR